MSVNPEALAASVTAAAIAIADSLPEDEATLLASVFMQLGDTLTTIITARDINKKRDADNAS
ncbi:MAG: hypothetical protein FWG36_02730 [Oscillospiraceae bacterium]|nr:hypothetical protein [Oscillospiraceae bacterium]